MHKQNKTLLLLLQNFAFPGSWKFVNHIVKIYACYEIMQTILPIYSNNPKIKAPIEK